MQEKPNVVKLIIPVLVFAIAAFLVGFNTAGNTNVFSFDPAPTQHFLKSGSSSSSGALRMLPTKVYHVTVTPTVANGGTLDISGFGLTTVANIQVTAVRNTTVANDVPTVSVKSFTTTSITYNVIQGNNAVVAILGINVLSGSPNVFVPTPTDVTLYFQITGW